jgi:uncharacterized protein (DUF2237 family)
MVLVVDVVQVPQPVYAEFKGLNMAYYVSGTNFFPGVYIAPTSTAAGSPLVASGTTGSFWAYPGNGQTPTGSLQTRSILTHGYTAGGYKNSNPWRVVNKTWHANDVTISCGEQLDQGAAYGGGTFSDYNGYCHGTNAGFTVANTHTSSYSLATGVGRTQNVTSSGANPGGPFGYIGKDPANDSQGVVYGSSGNNASGGGTVTTSTAGLGTWELSVGRTYFAGTQDQINQVGYISGGSQSNACDKFYFPTEIMYTTNSPGNTAVSHATGGGGATTMYWSFGGTNKSMTFSNDSWSTWSPGTTASPDGVCKMLTTKLGYHYVGTGVNVTTGVMKFSDTTGSSISTNLSKPSAQGEENFQMGQNWGYCLGAYSNPQNNYTFKLTHSSDTFTVLGVASQPKGHFGMSSGNCSSAAATVTMSAI